ncbi:MAG: putative bifunctional diguanylate cyclase/phosphodiesterase [Actinomycetota bacterium]
MSPIPPIDPQTGTGPVEVGHRRRPIHAVLGTFLALLLVAAEVLIFVSYRQASTTSLELQTATDTTTTLANLQREALLLQGLVNQLARPEEIEGIALRRQLLERQLGVLDSNVGPGDLGMDRTGFQQALTRFDEGLAGLQRGSSFSNEEANRVLLTPLKDLEVLAKRMFDTEEQALYGAIHKDLKQAERGQLLLGGLSSVVLLLGIALAFFLRRSVRADFARAHAALITEMRGREILQRQLSHQAYHDSMTGLANRALFLREIERSLARGERAGGSTALIYLDLDNFKYVNDTFGHDCGDELLRTVATRLEGCIRKTDTAARLGGDEFAILLENGGEAGDVVAVVNRIMKAMKQPFQLGDHVHAISASIGVVPAVDPQTGVDEVIRSADIAMYDAKSEGKGMFVIFDESMRIKAGRRASLERELEQAVQEEELVCFYQPIVNLKEQRIVGMEALVRWQHPSGELLPPAHFLQTAEETGLINQIGDQVLAQAVGNMAEWHRRLPEASDVFISVNVSSQQLQDLSFSKRVAATLQEAGLPPSALVIEITESTMMEETDRAARVLNELRELGVRVAIDDFGTGYSSLSYLRLLPIDILKIDRSFISSLPEEHAIAATIASLADTLGMVSIAEGIERDDQMQRLETMGCSLGQGFLISKPEPAEQAWARIQESYPSGARNVKERARVHSS